MSIGRCASIVCGVIRSRAGVPSTSATGWMSAVNGVAGSGGGNWLASGSVTITTAAIAPSATSAMKIAPSQTARGPATVGDAAHTIVPTHAISDTTNPTNTDRGR